MERQSLYQLLTRSFGFVPTEGQRTVLYHLAAFLLSEKPSPTYLLQGYAGTGKTTLVTTLVKTLPMIGMWYQLMAPTGRAAKVLSGYTGKNASTIHRKIYRFQQYADGSLRMTRAENKAKNTLFIVDECSMISDERSNGRSLLDDLINYVFSGENCKLLLIGDNAQLPPVGLENSPANDINVLKHGFGLTVAAYELTEVMRQEEESGILWNATALRQTLRPLTPLRALMTAPIELPLFNVNNFSDIHRIEPQEFEELLWQKFGDKTSNEAVIICRSNKRANMYNQAVRARILQEEGEISTGDKLMVVKNNYFWTDEDQKISFIANGDMIELMRINNTEEMYGFHFADVEIQLTDYQEEPNLSVKILLETLTSDSPALTQEETDRLYHAVEEDYMDIPNRRDRCKAMRQNPYFNALQVKFGYALTCHKTQGGQWPTVFLDAPFFPDAETHGCASLQVSDLRWFYTAVTRAQKQLYFVNFQDEYFFSSSFRLK
ncbi:MAG: AAA family ATPase [Bacteroidales bacterium]|nr:AAA family ATPase [Bacteroidales bacterium]